MLSRIDVQVLVFALVAFIGVTTEQQCVAQQPLSPIVATEIAPKYKIEVQFVTLRSASEGSWPDVIHETIAQVAPSRIRILGGIEVSPTLPVPQNHPSTGQDGANREGSQLPVLPLIAGKEGTYCVSPFSDSDPALTISLTETEKQKLINKCKQDTRSVLTRAPTVFVNESVQDSTVMDGSHRPFVVGVNHITDEATGRTAYQPVIGLFLDGFRLTIRSEATNDQKMKLDVRLETSQIESVRTYTLAPAEHQPNKQDSELGPAIQYPVVKKERHSFSADVGCDETLLVMYPTTRSERVEKSSPVPYLKRFHTRTEIVEVPCWTGMMVTVQPVDRKTIPKTGLMITGG